MLTRYTLFAVLAVSAIVGANKPAAAADKTGVSIEQSNVQQVIPSDHVTPDYADLSAAAEANQASTAVEVAAQWYATTCYTFDGPICPLAVLIPPGSACECVSPYGVLPGVAY
jgi:hypothetical protein